MRDSQGNEQSSSLADEKRRLADDIIIRRLLAENERLSVAAGILRKLAAAECLFAGSVECEGADWWLDANGYSCELTAYEVAYLAAVAAGVETDREAQK